MILQGVNCKKPILLIFIQNETHFVYYKENCLIVKESFFAYLESVTEFMSARDAAMEEGKSPTLVMRLRQCMARSRGSALYGSTVRHRTLGNSINKVY